MKWLPIFILVLALCLFFILGLQQYLSFEVVKQHRHTLLNWTEAHYFSAVLLYMLIYIIAVAVSIPGATFFTLIGGFLFGVGWGTLYVVLSATLGSLMVFSAVRLWLGAWIAERASQWVKKMRTGFQHGACQYMLVLRLIPLFPFWAVNIVAALLGVSTFTFTITTFFGIIPGSLVYVLIGNGLGYFFDRNQMPDLHIIYEPAIFIPLVALALLSLIPTAYQWLKGKKHESNHKL